MDLKIELAHDRNELHIWHNDGVHELNPKDAAEFLKDFVLKLRKLKARKGPPAPAPFKWDEEIFAEFGQCFGEEESELGCVGGIAKQEFYLSDLVALRDWINSVMDYHRKCGCKNLKKIEEKK